MRKGLAAAIIALAGLAVVPTARAEYSCDTVRWYAAHFDQGALNAMADANHVSPADRERLRKRCFAQAAADKPGHVRTSPDKPERHHAKRQAAHHHEAADVHHQRKSVDRPKPAVAVPQASLPPASTPPRNPAPPPAAPEPPAQPNAEMRFLLHGVVVFLLGLLVGLLTGRKKRGAPPSAPH